MAAGGIVCRRVQGCRGWRSGSLHCRGEAWTELKGRWCGGGGVSGKMTNEGRRAFSGRSFREAKDV